MGAQQGVIDPDKHIVLKKKSKEALLKSDHRTVAMQMAIKEKEMKIRDFQESNLRKARQVSAVQAALNRKERECCALQESKQDELQALKVLLVEKEQENAELKARLQKWDQGGENFQLDVEEMEPSVEEASENGVEGNFADNQGEELMEAIAQNDFIQNTVVQTVDEVTLTEVTLPVESFPKTALSDANGNMICLYSDTVEVEIFPNILSYEEQAASDHVKAKVEEEKFTIKYTLKAPREQVHSSEIPFARTKCSGCNKTFKSKYTLKAHVEKVHGSESPLACTKCEKKFTSKVTLKNHKEKVHTALNRSLCPAATSISSCQVKSSRQKKVPLKLR